MINTLAELLKELSEKENQRLKELDITHPPTIGAMYEGLTADIMQKALFAGLNLVVAKSSFIKGSKTEFDVILAEGEGKPVPYTDKFEFEPQQVLVVIQVKKTFNAKELGDSYENLMRIPELYLDVPPEDYMLRLATDSVHHTLQRSIEEVSGGKLSFEEEYVYHSLVTEAQLPVTVVLGYNGLKTESSLRERYYEYIAGKASGEGEAIRGYGPNNYPSLLICEDNSIVKMGGCPYNAPLNKSPMGWWDFMASTHFNPMYLFLDVIWTKLSYKYTLPSVIFGEDLETPKMTPFLSCRILQKGERIGWELWYHDYVKKDLESNSGTLEWEPFFLDEIQFRVMNILCMDGDFDFKEVPSVEKDAVEAGYKSLDDLIESLCKTGMVTKIGEHKIRLISRGCQVIMIDDKFIMGENISGRMDNWLMRHSSEFLPWMKQTNTKES